MPIDAYAPLTEIYPDPRLQLTFPNDAVIKTYATCPGGLVTAITRYGRLVASGVPLPIGERGPNTTVAVLLQPGAVGAATAWPSGEGYARTLNEAHPGVLVVQRLADLRRRVPTSAAALAANSVRPSCDAATPGALHDVIRPSSGTRWTTSSAASARSRPPSPTTICCSTAPPKSASGTSPPTILQSTVPGLFVAGDGPGQSQGAVQAGVAGLLAGTGLANYLS